MALLLEGIAQLPRELDVDTAARPGVSVRVLGATAGDRLGAAVAAGSFGPPAAPSLVVVAPDHGGGKLYGLARPSPP